MQEFSFLIVGIVLGGAVAWFWASLRLKAEMETKQQGELQQKDRLFEGKKLEFESQIQAEQKVRIQAEAQLQAQEKLHKEQMENMKISFENMAAKAVQNNNELFLQLAQQTMNQYVTKADSDFEKRELSILNLIKPLKQSLDKYEELSKNLSSNTDKIFGSLKMHLDVLSNSQRRLEKETGALVTALKSPKVRGRWGEIGLKRIVEFSGMSAYCDFQEQVNVSTHEGSLRPDMLVKLPDNKLIVIDSKVPLNAYLSALETDNEATQKQLMEQHVRAVKTHVKDLSSKAYWSQFSNTVDFVVLYIEVESAFGAALIQNPNLIVEALQNRVLFATPTTLIALLQTVAYSWKQHTATENALEIWKSGKELYERMAIFSEYLSKLGGGLNGMLKTYNQTVGSWEARIIPAIKKMEAIGLRSEKKRIATLEENLQNVRELKNKS